MSVTNAPTTIMADSNLLANNSLNASTDPGGGANGSDMDYYIYQQIDIGERAAIIFSQPSYSIAIGLGVIAILANVICLAALCQIKHSMPSHFRIVISLIIADLLVDFSLIAHVVNLVVNPVLPPGHGDYYPRLRSRCSFMIIKALNTMGLNICLLNLLAMAIDHYIAILKPFHIQRLLSRRRIVTMVILLWCIAFVAGFSDFLSPLGELQEFWFYRQKYNFCEFIWLSRYQEEFVTFGIAIICFFTMVFIYCSIFCKVRGMDPRSTVLSDMKLVRNKKAVITTLLILGTFVLCWLPTCIFNIALIILTKGGKDAADIENIIPQLQSVDNYLYDLMLLNTLCDPLIYVLRVREVRSGYWMLFQTCLPEGSRLKRWLQHKLARSRCNSLVSHTEDRRNISRRSTEATLKTNVYDLEDKDQELVSLTGLSSIAER